MISIKTPEEIKILSEGGKILASVLHEVALAVKPGVSAVELEEVAKRLIKKAGGKPAFLDYKPRGARKPYPAALCVSINDEVVHGIPFPPKIIKEGDVVGLDLGLEYKKLFTDMALTVGAGKISDSAKKLINITEQALYKGIYVLKDGVTSGDYGFAVQNFVEKAGFNVVRVLVGHGVGYEVHEDPDIPNWGRRGEGFDFSEGMVLALEPMVCQGGHEVIQEKGGWAWKTKDGLLSAHFEHTVVIEKNSCRILTKL